MNRNPEPGTRNSEPSGTPPLKVAILTGMDSPWIAETIASLARLSDVQVVGVLVDTEPAPLAARLRNLRRKVRREGTSYVWYRLGAALAIWLEAVAARVVAGCDHGLRIDSLPTEYRISVFRSGNLNAETAREMLGQLGSDIGIVLGTRILKRSTFAIPRLGCINLHLGKLPEYRGLPPGFWELYEGQTTAGVTVHFIDEGLDTGDVVGENEVQIGANDNPDSLRKKLEIKGAELLVRCVADFAAGRAIRTPQRSYSGRARSMPTRRQRGELRARSGPPSSRRPICINVVKALLHSLF